MAQVVEKSQGDERARSGRSMSNQANGRPKAFREWQRRFTPPFKSLSRTSR